MNPQVTPSVVRATMKRNGICVILPTFNNALTLCQVIEGVRQYSDDIIVVNDGSTDTTDSILHSLALSSPPAAIDVISYSRNRGKGYALKQGFHRARARGFRYAITIDTDGQHRPSDIPAIVAAIIANPGALIVGQRNLADVDINAKSSFANKFSNFWFRLQTFRSLRDTQTGFRAYPLHRLPADFLFTNRYEAELMLLVVSAWRGIPIVEVPIDVYYPPKDERVSHFRPGIDFARISILNTLLCLGALLYGLPMALWRGFNRLPFFNFEFKPFTRHKGVMRPAAITFGRIFRSLWGISFFVIGSVLVVTPATLLFFAIGRDTPRKRLRYHKMLRRLSSFIARNLPGASAHWVHTEQLDFSRPSVIICNHQSHLDLMMLMALDPKIIFLTNDWVWNNPFYGPLIRKAEFMPVTMGFDELIPRLRQLVGRGYSIMVFPEGTRSADGSVGRFHQGAFQIALRLGLDIQPMVLHGASDYLPKTDFMLRRGALNLKALTRIPADEIASSEPRRLASVWRKNIAAELAALSRDIQCLEYNIPLVKYRYAWRGRDILRASKRALRRLSPEIKALACHDFSALGREIPPARIRIIGSGIGVEAFLIALANPSISVEAYEPDARLHSIAAATGGRPDNLVFHSPVWVTDYGVDDAETFTLTLA